MLTATAFDSSLLSYLKKVYALLSLAVLTTMGTAYLAVTQGTPTPIDTPHGTFLVTPAVHFAVNHPGFMALAFIGLCIIAAFARKTKGLGAASFLFFAVASGLLLGPSIAYATFKASQGLTLTANPVRDAGLLTTAAFVGLSAFTLASRKDFSRLGAFLFTGLLVVILASFLNLFLGSHVGGLAIASVSVLLFVGFILHDTSKLVHGEQDDPVGDAMNLFLDVLNLFSDLLYLFANAKSE